MIEITTERLAELRKFATIERDAILEHEGRMGEDPLTTIISVPSVDEFVVRELETLHLETSGKLAEFSLARLAGRGTAADAAEHKANADALELSLLSEIAEACPELTRAVWAVAGRLQITDASRVLPQPDTETDDSPESNATQ